MRAAQGARGAPARARWTLAVLAALGCGGPPQDPARAESNRLLEEARREYLNLRYASATEFGLAALRADPANLPASRLLFSVRGWERSRAVRELHAAGAGATEPGLNACYRLVDAFSSGHLRNTALPEGPLSPDASLCLDMFATTHPRARKHHDAAWARATLARYPDDDWVALAVISLLLSERKVVEAEGLIRGGLLQSRNPLVRAFAFASLATIAHERDDDAAAASAERTVRDDPDFARPGFRALWASIVGGNHAFLNSLASRADPSALSRHVDSVMAMTEETILTAVREGDGAARLSWLRDVGVNRLDRGRLAEAVQLLSHGLALADSVDEPVQRGELRMRLGRALVKLGRHAEAERALLQARKEMQELDMPRIAKEVEHNLLHLYEGLGRWADAQRAGEEFVRQAALGPIDGVRMMSARDMGLFLRARGNLPASRAYFSRMLADIDSLKRDRYYGGEYLEMTGDFDAARKVYEQAVAASEEPMRALDGLVRIALAMGDTVGARRWATVHDARRTAAGRPESAPALPRVIAQSGSTADARAAFDTARRVTREHGQVAAWAALTGDLARVELRAGEPARASSLADSAAVAAAGVGDPESALRARGISARAKWVVSRHDSDLQALRTVAVEADRVATPLLRADVHTMHGDALAERGAWTEALGAYARAAHPLDSVARTIAMDPRRAEFRSAQRAVYNRALATIVRHADHPAAARAFAAWSERRKGRAFESGPSRVPYSRELPAPRPDAAVVDYVFLDSLVAAQVVSSRGARIVILSVSPPRLRDQITELRAALDVRVGSELDVKRARFPVTTAHELYRSLFAPLEPLLVGVRDLTVVPDGILHLVPFDALVSSPPANPRDEASIAYLIDRYTIAAAVTATAPTSPIRFAGGRVLAVAPLLPADGREEIAVITRAVESQRVRVLAGNAATRTALRSAIRGADLIHFAAHAVANAHDPEASYIELAPDPSGDHALRAADIDAIPLSGQVIVLSACETARGRVLEGEGVLSLGRSFLRAGARATVATLWPVGPQAAEFAGELYARVSVGAEVAPALREAKLAMRRAGSPAFAWAPFQLYVGPQPPQERRTVAARNDR